MVHSFLYGSKNLLLRDMSACFVVLKLSRKVWKKSEYVRRSDHRGKYKLKTWQMVY